MIFCLYLRDLVGNVAFVGSFSIFGSSGGQLGSGKIGVTKFDLARPRSVDGLGGHCTGGLLRHQQSQSVRLLDLPPPLSVRSD